ncbi:MULTISPECIES: hypothetical protein [unclassified Carboxylicivirga]|uniref:hypothetical protein n=1 Tax=Carboxylicivirga TaxID=1628153 RepID=UPI003D339195
MDKSIKVAVNIMIFLIVIGFIIYVLQADGDEQQVLIKNPATQTFNSDYQLRASIDVKDSVVAFELHGTRLYVAGKESVSIYNLRGERVSSFKIKANARDMAISHKRLFVLYPSFIEKYSLNGDSLDAWDACSELSDYASFTITDDFVFVSDVVHKNICKYTREGNFVQFIESPDKFITPSHFFDITHKNDTIYCANPGRHRVESYTLNGEFIAAFGRAGSHAGAFAGCCNPSYIHFDDQGRLLTSEKGNPRISYYDQSGTFNRVLLNQSMLGGGHLPYQIKTLNNKLLTAVNYQIKVFELKNQ